MNYIKNMKSFAFDLETYNPPTTSDETINLNEVIIETIIQVCINIFKELGYSFMELYKFVSYDNRMAYLSICLDNIPFDLCIYNSDKNHPKEFISVELILRRETTDFNISMFWNTEESLEINKKHLKDDFLTQVINDL